MTKEEIEGIKMIQGTLGFRVIVTILDLKIRELDSVSDIDGRSETRAGIQALAKNKAVRMLQEIKNEINLNGVSEKDPRRTYE